MALQVGRCQLRKLRKARNMSQIEVKEAMHEIGVPISTTLISQYERNEKICNNILTLKGLAKVLDCSIDDIYETIE